MTCGSKDMRFKGHAVQRTYSWKDIQFNRNTVQWAYNSLGTTVYKWAVKTETNCPRDIWFNTDTVLPTCTVQQAIVKIENLAWLCGMCWPAYVLVHTNCPGIGFIQVAPLKQSFGWTAVQHFIVKRWQNEREILFSLIARGQLYCGLTRQYVIWYTLF